MNNPVPQKAWYRHPYLWLVILLPVLAVGVSLWFVRTAFLNEDEKVRDDWYMDGKTLEQDLSRDQLARSMGIYAHLMVTDPNTIEVTLKSQQTYAWPAMLWLNFYHPTHAAQDLKLVLKQQSNGRYIAQHTNIAALSGKYHIELENGGDWRLQDTVQAPLTTFDLRPLKLVH